MVMHSWSILKVPCGQDVYNETSTCGGIPLKRFFLKPPLQVLNTVNGTLAEQASMSRNRSQKAANQSQEMKDQLTLKLRPRLERYNKVVEDTTAANQLTEEKLGKIQNKIGNMTGGGCCG